MTDSGVYVGLFQPAHAAHTAQVRGVNIRMLHLRICAYRYHTFAVTNSSSRVQALLAKLAVSLEHVDDRLLWLQGPAHAGNLGVAWRVTCVKTMLCKAVKAWPTVPRPFPHTLQLMLLQQLATELSEQLDLAGDAWSKQLVEARGT